MYQAKQVTQTKFTVANFYHHTERFNNYSTLLLIPTIAGLNHTNAITTIQALENGDTTGLTSEELTFIRALLHNDSLQTIHIARIRLYASREIIYPILALVLTVKPEISILVADQIVTKDVLLFEFSAQKRPREEGYNHTDPRMFKRVNNSNTQFERRYTEIISLLNDLQLGKDLDTDGLKKEIKEIYLQTHPDKCNGHEAYRTRFEQANRLAELVSNGNYADYLTDLRLLNPELDLNFDLDDLINRNHCG